jgi:hypothetical protein
LGDVLEHLPDPLGTLTSLVERLPVGGVVFVEGPLEVNPSPVYWFALAFGTVKKLVRPASVGSHPPTHLFSTNAASQQRFFLRLGCDFQVVDWRIEETGWPYSGGGLVKSAIAKLARAIGAVACLAPFLAIASRESWSRRSVPLWMSRSVGS